MTMPETARPIYDTYAAIRRLPEAGLPEPHAEAVVKEQVHLIEHDLATKADIAAVQADIETLRLETKADIEKLRLETKADIATLQTEIATAKNDLIRWMIGANFTMLAVVIAAFKLL